jgi:RNA polymerase sigma-70 factor (ECF subfamily)
LSSIVQLFANTILLRGAGKDMLQVQAIPNNQAAPNEPADSQLVELALRQPESFVHLFHRYATPVHRYCHRRLADREAAEDATQTTFMRAFSSLATCRDWDRFNHWLFAIAHNVITDMQRSQRPARLDDQIPVADNRHESPEDLAVAAAQHREMAALLSQLPELQRDVVELRLQGFADREIAEVLGKSHEAIRAAQHRALLQLRALMGVDTSTDRGHVER